MLGTFSVKGIRQVLGCGFLVCGARTLTVLVVLQGDVAAMQYMSDSDRLRCLCCWHRV